MGFQEDTSVGAATATRFQGIITSLRTLNATKFALVIQLKHVGRIRRLESIKLLLVLLQPILQRRRPEMNTLLPQLFQVLMLINWLMASRISYSSGVMSWFKPFSEQLDKMFNPSKATKFLKDLEKTKHVNLYERALSQHFSVLFLVPRQWRKRVSQARHVMARASSPHTSELNLAPDAAFASWCNLPMHT